MARLRRSSAAALLLSALVLTGCATQSPSPSPSETTQTDGGLSPAPEESADTGMTELLAVIGTADDPEAYVMGILDEDGEVVTSVPAGDYSLTFVDRSQMHNFRLTGEGVDVATDVQGTDESTVEITLVAGTYTFVCDPHASTMNGELGVTG